MSTLNATAYTPSTIGEVKFRIPLYQRPYAWEEKQITQLLSDLKSSFDTNKNAPYYVGILSVGTSYSNNSVYDLIDGQQRITTLTLIGLCLKKYHEKWNDFMNKRLDLYGREEDKKFIETLEPTPKTNPKMVEGKRHIEAFIDKIIEKEAFARYVYENASFFVSEVPEGYGVIDKNLQFVRMNNRGKQLEATDILKIKLASEIKSSPDYRTNFIKQWDLISQLGCTSNTVETTVNGVNTLGNLLSNEQLNIKEQPKESEIFYQSIITFPELLLITLKKFNENANLSFTHENKRDKLIEYFGFGSEDNYSWDEQKVLEFMQLLNTNFNCLDTFIIKRDKEEKYKLKNSDKFTSEENSLRKLIVFQSYMYVSREPQNWLPQFFEYLSQFKVSEISGEESNKFSKIDNKEFNIQSFDTNNFLFELKNIDNNYRKLPKLPELRYSEIDRYWFWRLDYYLWENWSASESENDVVRNFVFRPNRSIEHLHPQNQENVEKWTKTDIDSFGNIALISSSSNSTQSNDNVAVKFGRVTSQIERKNLESIKLLKMYIDAEAGRLLWSTEMATKHGKDMYQVLIDSFKRKE